MTAEAQSKRSQGGHDDILPAGPIRQRPLPGSGCSLGGHLDTDSLTSGNAQLPWSVVPAAVEGLKVRG
jgi:hypothetical protein